MSSQLSQIPQLLENYKETMRKSLRDPNKPWTKAFDILEERTSIDRVKLFSGESCLQLNSKSFTVEQQDLAMTHCPLCHTA